MNANVFINRLSCYPYAALSRVILMRSVSIVRFYALAIIGLLPVFGLFRYINIDINMAGDTDNIDYSAATSAVINTYVITFYCSLPYKPQPSSGLGLCWNRCLSAHR